MINIEIIDPVACRIERKNARLIVPAISFQRSYWLDTPRGKREKTYDYPLWLSKGKDYFFFLTGHLPQVLAYCRENNIQARVNGNRTETPTFSSPGLNGMDFRNDQLDAIEAAFTRKRGIIKAPTRTGKCHPKNTPILMYDGSIKMIQNVKIGDLVMGPDSTARRVLHTNFGFGSIYKITPNKGDPWFCNDAHILSLKRTNYFQKNGNGGKGKQKGGDIINIPLNEYLIKSKWFKHIWKQYRTRIIFKEQMVPYDPYIIGLYLAEGSKHNPAITLANIDPILKGNKQRGCVTWRINKALPFFNYIRSQIITKDDRRIPLCYKINSRENRLQLLAGLIDGDGYLDRKGYEIISKYEHLADDICFLARSLGLAAYKKEKIGTIKELNFTGVYWRINISGDCSIIPVKLERKKAENRNSKVDVLINGFSVNYDREDYYYGMTIDKDSRYVLGDFTVTHNSIIMFGICSGAPMNILFLGDKLDLVQQLADEGRNFGFNVHEVHGQRRDLSWDNRNSNAVFMVRKSANLLFKKRENYWMRDFFDMVIVDEVHHVTKAEGEYANILKATRAPLRFGFTATLPEKDVEAMSCITGFLGPLIYDLTINEAVEKGLLIKPTIKLLKAPKVKIAVATKYNNVYQLGIIDNTGRHDLVAKTAREFIEQGKSVLILVNRTDHGVYQQYAFEKILPGVFVPFLHGGSPAQERENFKRQLINKKILCCIVSTIWKEGINIPTLDVCINAAGGVSELATIQAVGRSLTKIEGKEQAIIVDIFDQCHSYLIRHFGERVCLYMNLGWM